MTYSLNSPGPTVPPLYESYDSQLNGGFANAP
jgi:hypothetical protein